MPVPMLNYCKQELLNQMEEESAQWAAKGGQRRAGVGANSR